MLGSKTLVGSLVYFIVFCIMLLLFYRFTVQNTTRIQEQNLAYADDAARQIVTRVSDQLQNAQNLISTYSYFLGQTLSRPNITIKLLKEMENHSPFDGLRFTDLHGRNFTADGIVTDVTDREFYQEGIKGHAGIAVIMNSRVFNQPILGFYEPVRYDGQIIGVLHGAYLSNKYLREMLETSYFGAPADVFLCLPSGEVIASSNSGIIKGNIIEYMRDTGMIDSATADAALEVFRTRGSGSFVCAMDSPVDNLCVMHMPQFGYMLVQAFPQKITDGMLKRANNAGFELEIALILLFACCAAFMLARSRIQKKRLENKNHELGMVIRGMNILFEGRYCVADLVTGRYEYISDNILPDAIMAPQGNFEDVITNRAKEFVDEEEGREFLRFFSLANITRLLSDQDTVTYLCHIKRDDREEWENVITTCLEREDGKAVKLLMARQNVTEMKLREIQARKRLSAMNRKERQYQLALTSNALCSYEINLTRDEIDGDVLMRNGEDTVSLIRERGFTLPCRASDFLKSWIPFTLPESREEYEQKADVKYLLAKFHEGSKEIDLDYWRKDHQDNEVCARQAFYMTRDEETGDIIAMTVTRDITPQVLDKRIQTKALQDALLLAQHANEAKTTFLSNMSHDIRTPMNAIIGFATIAASHLDNKNQVRDCLEKVLSSSNHLLSLINDILDMSRIESGKLQIKEQECNISELMHNLVNIIQPQVKAKQMQLFIDTFEVTNEDVITDPLKLTQVFINLLGNAVKYTPAGGTITFRLKQKAAFRHGWADYIFEVRDNGIGMTADFIKHIFEPFTRETTTTQSGIQGTGLGMAITKNIVEMLNGTINVQSERGKGSTFTVTLTIRLQDKTEKPQNLQALEGLRALVVDDDFHVCDSVNKMLGSLGLRSEWTTSGQEAVYRTQIAIKDNDPYMTYIIDWQMPGMNGVDTARKIRNIVGNDAAIIILTAYEWGDIEHEAREAGVTAFCAKPLFMSDLRNALLTTHNLLEEPQKTEPEMDMSVFKGARVLIVDDLEMNREVAEFILTESGFEVELAPDGTDAVEMVKASPEKYYDIILMDVQMPTMNGYEATRAIRNLERDDVKTMPIIAMTANALEEDRATALKSGMNDHISKPIDIKRFFEVLRKYFK